jgi:hypothetical protein
MNYKIIRVAYDPSKLTEMNLYCVEEEHNLLQHTQYVYSQLVLRTSVVAEDHR